MEGRLTCASWEDGIVPIVEFDFIVPTFHRLLGRIRWIQNSSSHHPQVFTVVVTHAATVFHGIWLCQLLSPSLTASTQLTEIINLMNFSCFLQSSSVLDESSSMKYNLLPEDQVRADLPRAWHDIYLSLLKLQLQNLRVWKWFRK